VYQNICKSNQVVNHPIFVIDKDFGCFTLARFVTSSMWGHYCNSKMGIQICSQISDLKSLTLVIRVPSFFMNRLKKFPKIIYHFVNVGPLFNLQNGYLREYLDTHFGDSKVVTHAKSDKLFLRIFTDDSWEMKECR